ncbi:MAG: VCBS repeat-containing protein [bacterium]|nr:VCBS repeat-containing protein [bacterium]
MRTKTTNLSAAAAVLLAPALAAQINFTSQSLPVGTRPDEIALADVDRDGDLDFVVATDAINNSVELWRNDGAGNFTFANAIPVAPQTRSVVLHDFDGDGDNDLAVATGSAIAILPNLGGGAFGVATFYPVGLNPRGLTVADFDGSGTPDLAVANRDSNSVSVLMNAGGGTFTVGVPIVVGTEPRNVIAADFNRDGTPDLAASNHRSRDVSVLYNNGNGTFGAGPRLPVGANVRPEWVTAADTDLDGDLELVVALGEVAGRVGVFTNPGNGAFQGQQLVFVGGNEPGFVLLVDLDGNQTPDLVTGNEDSNDLSVLPNLGGTFGAATVLPVGLHPDFLVAGDIDGDRDLDLLCSLRNANSVVVLRNRTVNAATRPTMLHVGPFLTGASNVIELAAPTERGKPYVAGLSFRAGPGLSLPDNRTIPLGSSILLTVSVTVGNPIFPDAFGVLDGSGHANVRFVLPTFPSLAGLNVFGAFLTLDGNDPTGIGEISSPLASNIQ